MGKPINIDLDTKPMQDVPAATTIEQLAAGQPSVSNARKDAVRKAPRTQMNFSNIPLPVKTAFEAGAKKAGMGLKEFYYHCLRAGGVDIPDYQELDGRRR